MEPQFRFCTSADGTRIAYATLGSGAPLIAVLGWGTSFEAEWKDPDGRAWAEELAANRQLIRCERRGSGVSGDAAVELSMAAGASDIAAVADQLGSASFDLFGAYDGAGVVAAYAASNPDRVDRIIFWAPFVRGSDTGSPAMLTSLAGLFRTNWKLARRSWTGQVFPSGPQARALWYNELLRESFTPEVAAGYIELIRDFDGADLFRRVRNPTLVFARDHDRLVPPSASKITASLLADATFTPIAGDEGYPPFGDRAYLKRLVTFLDEGRARPQTLRSGTAVILFTDIADSTALTERMGDAAFRDASRALDAAIRKIIHEAEGKPVEGKVLGDGVLGVFSSAAQAIKAARRADAVSSEAELPIHIGLHAGDVIREDDNVYGGAVNIASRICGLCAPGEILVSQTVRDLARTSAGVTFEGRGEHMLKGIEDPVRVFAVLPAGGD